MSAVLFGVAGLFGHLLVCKAQEVNFLPLMSGVIGYVQTASGFVSNGSTLYIGGDFTSAGGVNASHVAMWDGSVWSALGSGVNDRVEALAEWDSALYVGGRFTLAGGVNASHVAKWDGSSWSALGSGTGGVVVVLTVWDSELYAGGGFTSAGGVDASNVAKWDGSSWSALGSGVDDDVYTLKVWDSALYVGGVFRLAGSVSASHVAKWNGSSWSALGSGTDDVVVVLTVWDSALYAGGSFTSAGGVDANYVAKWDGSSWSALGSSVDHDVYTLVEWNSALYAGGQFTSAGGTSANRVAKWDGNSWSALGIGVDSTVIVSAVSTEHLFFGGEFINDAEGIGQLNGIAMLYEPWRPLASGVDNEARALEVWNTDLYVGGAFTSAGSVSASRVAKWDGNSWSALGGGVDGAVFALEVWDSALYAGGGFTSADGVSASRVAKWDGNSWSALGGGVDGAVFALKEWNSALFVGGAFTSAGGVSVNNVAKWDGSEWSALGIGVDDWVNALAVWESTLYAGGYFTSAGGTSANRVAKWDGSSWSGLGIGLDDKVNALAVWDSALYVGGTFYAAGGVDVSKVAKWDGNSWSTLGSGVEDEVTALAMWDSALYVGGWFTSASGVSTNHVAKWDGSEWSALAAGVDDVTWALAGFGTDVIAGTQSNLLHANLSIAFPQSSSSLITLPNEAIVETQIFEDISLFIAVGLAAFIFGALVVGSRFVPQIHQTVPALDLFSLDRYTPEGESPKRQSTVFGGSLSVAMAVCVIGIAVNTAVSFFATTDVQSQSLIPLAHSTIQSTSSKFELAMTVSSQFAVTCPTTLGASLPKAWNFERVSSPPSPNATTACSYLMTCDDCSSTDFSTIDITLPFWFQSATWALATQLPAFPGEARRRSLVEGGWNGSSLSSTADTEKIRVSVTADVRTINREKETGCVVTIEDIDSTTSYVLSPTTITFRLSASGFVFETVIATQSTAASQAVSIIIATVSGIVAFFRFVSSTVDSTTHHLESRRKRRETESIEMVSPIESHHSTATDWAPTPERQI